MEKEGNPIGSGRASMGLNIPNHLHPTFHSMPGKPGIHFTNPMPRPMALNQGQGITFSGLGQPMDVNRPWAPMMCYNSQCQGHMAHSCCNPCILHQQLEQMEEVLAQGA